jgi:hypothetical protein
MRARLGGFEDVLEASCASWVGRDLFVRPYYGWGWRRDGVPLSEEELERIDGAGCFAVRVERLFVFGGALRGVVGRIAIAEHPLGGLEVVAAEMLTGRHDFVERLCMRYDLQIGLGPATGEDWPCLADAGTLEGYGALAASPDLLGDGRAIRS